MNIKIRSLTEDDVGVLRLLSQSCPPLGQHTAFTYWVMSHFNSDYGFLALDEKKKPIGFVACITKRDEPDLLYIWQIGVLAEHRRHKVAQQLLEALLKKLRPAGFKRIQVTIDPENKPSNGLFEDFARKHGFGYEVVGRVSFTDPIEDASELENLVEIQLNVL